MAQLNAGRKFRWARGKPHCYDVSKALLTGRAAEAGKPGCIPGKALEDLVADQLAQLSPERGFAWRDAIPRIQRIVVRADMIEIAE